jgi:GH15 family glucan-1,4-alpha-glucosidase
MTSNGGAMTLRSDPGYLPIADYGVIGNLRTTALVGRNGSIDWCCMPDLDSPSVFGGLLDRRIGGRFRITVNGGGRGEQWYLRDTAVLVTRFETAGGALEITDFMPVADGLGAARTLDVGAEIHRIVRCIGAPVDMRLAWVPRPDYARATPAIDSVSGGFTASAGAVRVGLALSRSGARPAVLPEGAGVVLDCTLQPGDVLTAVSAWGGVPAGSSADRSLRLCAETLSAWRDWVCSTERGGEYAFAAPWREALVRSGITLKLLTYAPTGAIAAAATTSLPEEIGGVRNWDYRYTWIRDSAFTAQAFFALGHPAEALNFVNFTHRIAARTAGAPFDMQIMYGLRGETSLPETVLDHLEGYQQSAPVRIGNAASRQRQLDIYGELLNAADELVHADGSLEPGMWQFLCDVADYAASAWREPDYGIWEVRSGPEHFTYSKVMIWVALDRAIWLAEELGLPAPLERWRHERRAVRQAVLEHGVDPATGAFVRAFGSRDLDAVNLLIPLVEFLPFEDARVQRTIDATLEQLTHGGMVYRYLAHDGLPGGEGTFGLATFWLVDALAMSGRTDEACGYFEGMLGRANHLGLYAEQVDASTGALLGNFPQGFTHVGLINSLVYLAHAAGRPLPFTTPLGSPRRKEERT